MPTPPRYALQKVNKATQTLPTLLVAGTMMVSVACNRNHGSAPGPQEDFHADNDIAMTVSSVADAIEVDEPLTSEDYDFEGVLTDGQGSPLYTAEDGTPGRWTVRVMAPDRLEISNTLRGDLLAASLRQYLSASLGTGDPVWTQSDEDEELGRRRDRAVYLLGRTVMEIETVDSIAPEEEPQPDEGPMVTITLRSQSATQAPPGD